MNLFAFDQNIRRQIRSVIDYANLNIYNVDDILDMMNDQMVIPGDKPGHLVLVPIGRWICYYIVDHPEKGRCHYFSVKPDASGKLLDKPEIEYLLKEFQIETPLLDKHVSIDKEIFQTNIILPIS